MGLLLEQKRDSGGVLDLGRRSVEELRRFTVKRPVGAFALALVLMLVFLAVFAPVVSPYDPLVQHSDAVMEAPDTHFLFGTDYFGRDILSRVIYGARISLTVGIASVALGLAAGVLIGLVTAYVGGATDILVQRLMDAALAFPGLIFALAIVTALGPRLITVILAIGFTAIPRNNRVVRGSVLAEKNNLYVTAAGASGCSQWRIMWRHILPNVAAPIIIIGATELGAAILLEASLSFLGVGVPPPSPSWGSMLSGEYRTYMLAAPWMAFFPGVAISLAVLGWNLLGDALRDAWDPRLRGS
ncbi:MAG TPA: ABC transporter permease [Dehalococcoidia bacterium]|nr:ABC transporter permease [Dehalococcoidia bacterium]